MNFELGGASYSGSVALCAGWLFYLRLLKPVAVLSKRQIALVDAGFGNWHGLFKKPSPGVWGLTKWVVGWCTDDGG